LDEEWSKTIKARSYGCALFVSHLAGLSPSANPMGPATGKYRVLRGGSWNSPSSDIEVTYRVRYYPNVYSFNLGFRCAKSVP
jgi:formylglycine-generating enzyme required for sulfatase activity